MRVVWVAAVLHLAAYAVALPLDAIKLPPGFKINLFADSVPGARSLAVSPSGVVYVSTKDVPGAVYGLLDSNSSGKADVVVTLLQGLNAPNGIAWYNNSLWVAEIAVITRYDEVDSFVGARKVHACFT